MAIDLIVMEWLLLISTGVTAVDFVSEGLNAYWGMRFPINAKNDCYGIGKVANNLIHHVSDVHKTPAKAKLDNLLLSNQ